MTKLKVGGLGAAALAALEPHVPSLYASPGKTTLAVIELEHVERTQPGPRSDKEPSVTVKVTHAEVPSLEQEPTIREVLRALYLQRTARGTLDEAAGTVVLEEHTVRLAVGHLHATDAAAGRVALEHFAAVARNAHNNSKATAATMAADLRGIADGIQAYLTGSSSLLDPDD